ncbi:hypothetical protein [Polaromonas sp.]|uniref:hypothetical protein n=1 Tax=Polaromonas sp. TaxID=1869339 RepID=UPI00352B0900
MAKNPTGQDDKRIDELHAEATKLWPKLEKLIDEMKKLGPHSLNGNNALDNTRNRLRDLSQR